MSRCRSNIRAAACLAAALAQARADEAPVEVFTDSTLFRLPHAGGAAVYDLSAPRRLADALGQGLPQNPAEAQAAAAARFEAAKQRLAAAYRGHALAAHYGIAKIPAVVFNRGEAVAYGLADPAEAAALYRRWKGEK